MENVISIQHLNKSFGSNQVLRDLDLELKENENVVVLGKSGSGKSVLIKCIIGLMQPDSGNINVLGKEITQLDHDELDKIRMQVGFLFQSNALYDSMSVRENLEFPLRRHHFKTNKRELNELVMEALNNVGLAQTADMMPAELSGGMRKRIALARTLILKPKIILYDEPTSELDPLSTAMIGEEILKLQSRLKATSLVVSHDRDLAFGVADRIAFIHEGRIVAVGTPDEIRHHSNTLIQKFLNVDFRHLESSS